ncbi:hypothetical protein SNEBB_009758 [Seison nebaliae]|nr:hypothetical protein SNEBB_009758 [Seison nebaliae]
MANFSSGLKLNDLNDFINPSLECIIPGSQVSSTNEKDVKFEPISLKDCLACSGCITSSESILLSEQNPDQFNKLLKENLSQKKIIVVSIASQCISSFANRENETNEMIEKKLSNYFHEKGCHYVITTEMGHELLKMKEMMIIEDILSANENRFPLICSSCPGWTCYAEKTRTTQYLLKSICPLRSAQEIIGILLRKKFGENFIHITIASCYDKKLEVYREEKLPNIHCVLTTDEVDRLINLDGLSLIEMRSEELNELSVINEIQLKKKLSGRRSAATSDGHVDFILDVLKEKMEGVMVECQRKNKNYLEYHLTDTSGNTWRLLKIYGFANIQKAIRKLKIENRKNVIFIEMMACPNGCLNGGGQLKKTNMDLSIKNWNESLHNRHDYLENGEEMMKRLKEQLVSVEKQIDRNEFHKLIDMQFLNKTNNAPALNLTEMNW